MAVLMSGTGRKRKYRGKEGKCIAAEAAATTELGVRRTETVDVGLGLAAATAAQWENVYRASTYSIPLRRSSVSRTPNNSSPTPSINQRRIVKQKPLQFRSSTNIITSVPRSRRSTIYGSFSSTNGGRCTPSTLVDPFIQPCKENRFQPDPDTESGREAWSPIRKTEVDSGPDLLQFNSTSRPTARSPSPLERLHYPNHTNIVQPDWEHIMSPHVGVLEASRFSFLDNGDPVKQSRLKPNEEIALNERSFSTTHTASVRSPRLTQSRSVSNFRGATDGFSSHGQLNINNQNCNKAGEKKPKHRPATLVLDKDLPPLPSCTVSALTPKHNNLEVPRRPMFAPKSAGAVPSSTHFPLSAIPPMPDYGLANPSSPISVASKQNSTTLSSRRVIVQPGPSGTELKLKREICKDTVQTPQLKSSFDGKSSLEADLPTAALEFGSMDLPPLELQPSGMTAAVEKTELLTSEMLQTVGDESQYSAPRLDSSPNIVHVPSFKTEIKNGHYIQEEIKEVEEDDDDDEEEEQPVFGTTSNRGRVVPGSPAPSTLSMPSKRRSSEHKLLKDRVNSPLITPRVDSLPSVSQNAIIRSASGRTTDTSSTVQSNESLPVGDNTRSMSLSSSPPTLIAPFGKSRLSNFSMASSASNINSRCSSMCSVDAIEGMLKFEVSNANAVHLCNPEDQPRIQQKFSLIRELVDTEFAFASDMAVLMDVYYRSLNSPEYFGYVSRTDILKLFSNVDQALALSRQFSCQLAQTISSYVFEAKKFGKNMMLADVETHVADVFLEFMPAISASFQAYCDTNQTQMDTFYRLRTLACPKLDKWLSACFDQSKPLTSAWTLDALLIKPVQRLLKYPLLLSGLVKCTLETHPDYAPLKRALDIAKQTAEQINENTKIMQSLQQKGQSHRRSGSSGSVSGSAAPGKHRRRSIHKRHRPGTSGSDYLEDAHYGDNLLNLKHDFNADEILQDLVRTFYNRKRQLHQLIQSTSSDVASTQQHFNCNSHLAKMWLSWSLTVNKEHAQTSRDSTDRECIDTLDRKVSVDSQSEDAKASIKRYRHYALFSSPFTSQSNTQLSTTHLTKRIKREVLRPLDKVRAMWERTEFIMNERRQYHASYSLYVKNKSDYSYAVPASNALTPKELQEADLFVKYHISLKDGLPDLFRLTDKMIGLAMSKYVGIQKEWFRVAMDSMASVFDMQSDLQNLVAAQSSTERDEAIVSSFHAQSRDSRDSVEQLGLFQTYSGSSQYSDVPLDETSPSQPLRGLSGPAELFENEDLVVKIQPTNTHLSASLGPSSAASSPQAKRKVSRKGSLLSLSNWQKTIRSPSRLASN